MNKSKDIRSEMKIACEDVGLYYASNLLTNDIIEVVVIMELKKKAYNIKKDRILKIDYISSKKRIFLKESGYLEYGISKRISEYHINSENCLCDSSLVKKINNKEGVIEYEELVDLQKFIDSAIKYEKRLDLIKQNEKIENYKEALEAKKNYSQFEK